MRKAARNAVILLVAILLVAIGPRVHAVEIGRAHV